MSTNNITEVQQRSRNYNEAVKDECIAKVKVAATAALIKNNATGEVLDKANKIIDALVALLEAKPAAAYLGAEYEGDKGTMLLIKQHFAEAKASA